jgi:cytochrome o ubiquinol oxidase operon protein cyoD
MTDHHHHHHFNGPHRRYDVAPGEETSVDVAAGTRGYLLGVALATMLSIASFWAAQTHLIYAPGIPIALGVLAVAQMGVHLVFFLHISSGPDNTNNILALAFGVLIVILVVVGSLWIMYHLNQNMLPMDQLMKMQS